MSAKAPSPILPNGIFCGGGCDRVLSDNHPPFCSEGNPCRCEGVEGLFGPAPASFATSPPILAIPLTEREPMSSKTPPIPPADAANTCGLKSPPALPEKDTYGFGVGHLLRAARSGPR